MLLLTLAGCAAEPAAEAPSPAAATLPPAPPGALAAARLAPDELATLSRLLAGMAPPPAATDAALQAVWEKHGRTMEASWSRLDQDLLQPIRGWVAQELDGLPQPSAPLVYPFGGPDYLNAALFFPAARSYVLGGLEPLGDVPRLEELDAARLAAELARLRGTLSHLTAAGYFVAKRMETDLAGDALGGVLPVLLLFVARLDQTPVAVRPVALDPGGGFRELPAEEAGAAALRIDLTSADGEPRSLYYLQQDVADGALADGRLAGALAGLAPFNVYMKSAEYLPHEDGFSRLRQLLLADAAVILQDDSGLPWRAFDPARWTLTLYGHYRETLPVYRAYFQEDLQRAFDAGGARPLGFAIGYNAELGGSPLILAVARR